MKSIPLNNEQQQIVMDTIYNMKNNKVIFSQEFNQLIDWFIFKNTQVVLACTELSSLEIPTGLKTRTLDAMDVLMRESVSRCGKEWVEI